MNRDGHSMQPETRTITGVTESAHWSDYLALTKPRLSLLSVLTAVFGYLAAVPEFQIGILLHLFTSTALAAAGVATLNQWLEWETDARMQRTRDRPIPTGKIATGSAFVLGNLLWMAGVGQLYVAVNGLAALLGLATVIAYLCWYTPAKRWSRISTEIGAISGALPPLIGWAAAEGTISLLGWLLFAILFFWQMPHFFAIAWMYRQDYAAVGFPMLPVRDASGDRVARWSLAYTIGLVAVSLAPGALGLTGLPYLVVAALLGGWILTRAGAFLRKENRETSARRLFLASVLYLPVLLLALVVDRWMGL